MSEKLYRPRLSIEITEEQYSKMNKVIPWGVRSRLFSVIIDDLVHIIEIHGEMAIAAIISREANVLDILKAYKEVENEHRLNQDKLK